MNELWSDQSTDIRTPYAASLTVQETFSAQLKTFVWRNPCRPTTYSSCYLNGAPYKCSDT